MDSWEEKRRTRPSPGKPCPPRPFRADIPPALSSPAPRPVGEGTIAPAGGGSGAVARRTRGRPRASEGETIRTTRGAQSRKRRHQRRAVSGGQSFQDRDSGKGRRQGSSTSASTSYAGSVST